MTRLRNAFLVALLAVAQFPLHSTAISGGDPKWQYAAGPSAREITTIFADRFSREVLYAGLSTGEIYRSDNNGTDWVRLGLIKDEAIIHRFIATPDTPTVLYAATNVGLFRAAPGKRRWLPVQIQPLPTGNGVRSLAIDPWEPSTFYAGTESHGIVKSTDGGQNWVRINGPLSALSTATVYDLTIDFTKPNVLVSTVFGLGVIMSEDAGQSWRRLTPEFTATGSQAFRVLVGGKGGHEILYATASGNIAVSRDGGQTWSPTRIAREGGAIINVEQSSVNSSFLIAGTESGLMISTNFGSSWGDYCGSLPHVRTAGAYSGGNTSIAFAYGENIGLQRTVDGSLHWETIDKGLGGSTLKSLSANESATKIYAVMSGTILTLDPVTMLWNPMGFGIAGDTVTSTSVAGDDADYALATTNLGAFRTTDGGKGWTPLSNRIPLLPRVLTLHPKLRTRVLAANDRGIFISTDRGYTWGQSQPVTARVAVNSFTFAPTNATVIYASTANAGALITRNGGFSWENARYGISSDDIDEVSLDDQDFSVAYAWTGSHEAFRTTNGGLEWNRYAPPWSLTDTVSIAFDRFLPSSGVAIVNGKSLYYTVNGGGTWIALPMSSLPGNVSALLWNEAGGWLYAGVRHRGLYRLYLKPSIVEKLKG